MSGRATTVCFLLLVAGRDFGCARGMIFMCQQRCMRLYPGSTGYCQGFRCMCDTHIPIRRPPFFMG
ncbi:longicornsin-like isoform X2 [Dermacentor variabilis]|uniref:longicornsin-like isoform X2 n=1 Tax=Dermacentor variabilis TaxID=34621 RepID=UPI003F5C075F